MFLQPFYNVFFIPSQVRKIATKSKEIELSVLIKAGLQCKPKGKRLIKS